MIAFLGSLPVPLQNSEWIQSYSDNFAKKGDGNGKWHTKIRIVDPYGNMFDQGYETKAIERKLSKHYKLSDIMSPNQPQGVVNNMGCVKEIEAMLEIKVYEMGEEEEIFSSELISVWISQKSQENSKNKQARTRESEEYKAEAKNIKPKS
ncbi:hypothetical protein Tco_0099351 [Tanacetum coccineum]